MKNHKFKFNLGDEVKCRLTGFQGVITGRTQYLTGCDRFNVKPPLDKDGKMQDTWSFDENELELVTEKKVVLNEPKTTKEKGGPERPVRDSRQTN